MRCHLDHPAPSHLLPSLQTPSSTPSRLVPLPSLQSIPLSLRSCRLDICCSIDHRVKPDCAMDLSNLKEQVSNMTMYDLKAGVRKVQNGEF